MKALALYLLKKALEILQRNLSRCLLLQTRLLSRNVKHLKEYLVMKGSYCSTTMGLFRILVSLIKLKTYAYLGASISSLIISPLQYLKVLMERQVTKL